MLYQASTGVDYAAHLAGAIGGGVLGYLVTTAWTAESFRPPFARRAAAAAFSVLLVACVSLAFAASQFRARAELAAERIPAKAIPVALPADAKLVADLVARYPKDPRGRLLRGHALAAKGAFGAAETELRQAVSLSTRPYDARVRMTANSYLALVVMKRGGSTEAAQLAKEGCATKELRPLREMLRAARLCNESPEARLPLAISRAPGQSLRPRGAAPQYNGLGR
jgi:rhomboid protease GluP